jgi:CheY-like chemotaxis protein
MTNIVFIDDDPDIAGVIQAIADRDCECHVEIFDNGADALKHLNAKETKADVVVLDLMLPTLDGLTIAEEIRRNEDIHLIKGPVKLIFLTAADISDAVQRVADRVGVERILQKPVDYTEVLNEIKGGFGEKFHETSS